MSDLPANQFFQPGAVVYFKKCLRRPKSNSDAMASKNGYAFGILLGVVPPFTKEPDIETVFCIAAQFGMVTIDSIIELMGEEIAHQYLAKLQAKHAANAATEEVPQPPPTQLVGANGMPVCSAEVAKLLHLPQDIQ